MLATFIVYFSFALLILFIFFLPLFVLFSNVITDKAMQGLAPCHVATNRSGAGPWSPVFPTPDPAQVLV